MVVLMVIAYVTGHRDGMKEYRRQSMRAFLDKLYHPRGNC